MTNSELVKEVFSIVETKVLARPTAAEFEMAYQARIAIERIRFAIRASEKDRTDSAESVEAGIQLMDALDRLESIDRRFQERSRAANSPLSSTNGAFKAATL